MPIILELSDSPKQKVSRDPSQQGVTRRFMVTGPTDDVTLRAYLASVVPLFYAGLILRNYNVDPQGADVWIVETDYGMLNGADGGPNEKGGGGGGNNGSSSDPNNIPTINISFSFKSEGAKVKVTHGWTPSSYYPAPDANNNPRPVIDFKDAIGLKKQPGGSYKIEGVDEDAAIFNFTVHRTFGPLGGMTGPFIVACQDAAFKVNSDVVEVTLNGLPFHFEPGELYFKGANGLTKAGGVPFGDYTSWEGEVSLEFARQANLSMATIAGVENVNAKGWDHIEVVTEEYDDTVANIIVQRPRQININHPKKTAPLMPLFQ